MSTALGPYSRTNNFVFDPSQVSGLALWLDAADDATVIRTGVNITRWDDKSGNRRNVTASGTPTYVANSLGGLNSINFATSASFFTTPSIALTSSGSFTMFFIYNFVSAVVGNTDFFITPSSYAIFDFFIHTSGTQRLQLHLDSLTPLSTSLIPTRGIPYIYGVNYNYTSGALNVFANGTNIATNTRTTNLLATPQIYNIGAQSSNAFYYESVIYNNSLTTAQQQQVESYLAWKWGLQRNLPTTHPYFNSPYVAYNQIVNIPQRIFNNNTLFPNQVPGLALWLDGADPLNNGTTPTSGTVISTWSDKSGNGYNATVASGRIAGTFNTAFNCVYFQSSSVGYATNYPANPTNETMFIVANIDSPANINNNTIICGQRGARSFGFGYSGIGGIGTSSYLNSQVAWQNTFVTGPPTQTTSLITGTVSNTTNVTVSLNGATTGASYTSGTIVAWTAGTTTYLAVDTTNTSYYFKGYVMEILFYNSIISTTQRQQIEGYLAYKWNIKSNLPLTHPTYTPPFVPSGSISVKPYIWAPTQISGCALWLDAADSSRMTLAGSNITQYIDKSSNGIILSNTTVSQQPTLVYDSTNTPNILFNGTSQFLQNSSVVASNLTVNNEISIFFVHTPVNNNNSLICWTNSGTPRINFHTPEGTGLKFDYASAGAPPTGGRLEISIPNYLTSGRRLEGGYKRGTLQVLRTYGSTVASTTNILTITASTSLKLTFGAFAGATPYGGRFCELVWFNRGLTDNEINQIEGYLAWKWNLQKSLPSSHPFFNFPQG